MAFLRNRPSKILATVGPASNTKGTLNQLIDAGADAFRLNFSHGTHDDHKKVYAALRELEAEKKRPLCVLQDLQGPKIRLGEVTGQPELEVGQRFILDEEDTPGDDQRAPLPHPEVLQALKPGDHVYINDGLVKLEVNQTDGSRVTCDVRAGGVISSRKGVNLPSVDLPVSAMTEKDKKDAQFGMELGVDWVALSFVQRPEDVQELRDVIGESARIMAKIEKPNAVERIDDIINISDGIMIARGDLGVEIPLEEVPPLQKKIIRKCRDVGKPVVVATQMLESMVHNSTPTRAEVSDVANAAFEGADALMLSAESASGKYPVQAVEVMNSVLLRVAQSSTWQRAIDRRRLKETIEVGDAITGAAYTVADTLKACAIVTFTESGSTALRMSRRRPLPPILAITPNERTARRLALVWGLNTTITDEPANGDNLIDLSVKTAKDVGLAGCNKDLVIVAGIPFGVKGSTNMVRVEHMGDE